MSSAGGSPKCEGRQLNWNSARFAEKLPVTVRFANEVGAILRDLPDDYTPEARFAYYM